MTQPHPGVPDEAPLRVSLVTLGDPDTMTGGYLYHRRIADRAPAHSARLEFVSFPRRPFPLPALAGRAVLREIDRQRPDVVVLDSIAAAFLAPWLTRRRARALPPIAGILHQAPGGVDHTGPRQRFQAVLDRRAYRHVHRLLLASDDLATRLRAAGMPDALLRVVPPGRDPSGDPVPPGDLRRGRRAAALSVGNWVDHKGLLDLLDALAPLPDDTLTLHLVGDTGVDPPYAARVRARLAEGDLAGRVVVHGKRTPAEVAGFYAAADLFVLAAERETYGTVFGEAMAAGLPVVGWAAGNLPHLARDGVEGVVVPPHDTRGLGAALRSLSTDKDLRERMGTAAARRAGSFPTWDETAAAFFAELRAVVREAPSRISGGGSSRGAARPSRPASAGT